MGARWSMGTCHVCNKVSSCQEVTVQDPAVPKGEAPSFDVKARQVIVCTPCLSWSLEQQRAWMNQPEVAHEH